MKEQINRYEKYGLLYPITFAIMAILMVVQGIMVRSTLFFFSFLFSAGLAIMFFYLVKNRYFKKMNVGSVVGSVLTLLGVILINVLMLLSCQIPDFAMQLIWIGFGIVMISVFYDMRKARR